MVGRHRVSPIHRKCPNPTPPTSRDYDDDSLDPETFQEDCRCQFGAALVSSGKIPKVEAGRAAGGLFLREFNVNDDGDGTPREVTVAVRIYACCACPAAVDLGFEHYHRDRMFSTEKYAHLYVRLAKPDAAYGLADSVPTVGPIPQVGCGFCPLVGGQEDLLCSR